MTAFRLHSEYTPAGDQPAAITSLVEGLQTGLAHQTLLGVTGSGKTFTIANVIHNQTLAAQLYGEFREFFPDNAVEYFVSYYDYYQPEAYVPSSDTYIEKDASINEHIEQMRLSATKALLERPDAIIVATVSSIYGLGDPEAYLHTELAWRRGWIWRWCCIWCGVRSSISASCCGVSPTCSTRVTRSTSARVRSVCGATSSTSSRPSRSVRR